MIDQNYLKGFLNHIWNMYLRDEMSSMLEKIKRELSINV